MATMGVKGLPIRATSFSVSDNSFALWNDSAYRQNIIVIIIIVVVIKLIV